MTNQENFTFTYSAEQQKEIEAIRKKYLPKEENKMEQLRKLHAIPTQKAMTMSVTIGIIGALTMGTGMSLAMTDIGVLLGDIAMLIGVLIGLGGMILVVMAYPVYNRVLNKQRAKIAPEILRLSEELLGN